MAMDFPPRLLMYSRTSKSFLIAQDGIGIGGVARSEDDDGKFFIHEGIGAVAQFTGGEAFGLDVGNFLELERAFASESVVDAAAEEQEGFGMLESAGAAGSLSVPRGEGLFDGLGDFGKGVQVRARDFGSHAAALAAPETAGIDRGW